MESGKWGSPETPDFVHDPLTSPQICAHGQMYNMRYVRVSQDINHYYFLTNLRFVFLQNDEKIVHYDYRLKMS